MFKEIKSECCGASTMSDGGDQLVCMECGNLCEIQDDKLTNGEKNHG